MAVKIRLRRMGARGRPFYRVVVADSRTPRDGRFIEILGYYDPCTEPPIVKIDNERAQLWLSRGAQPSDTAAALLKKEGLLSRAIATKATPGKEEATPAEPVAIESEAPAEPKAKAASKTKSAKSDEAQAETAPAAVVEETAVEPQAAEIEQTAEEQSE